MTPSLVVTCPAGAVTGGPEALHQLVAMANEIESGSAAICYAPFENTHGVPEPYRMYATPVIQKENIPNDALVVLPEIWSHLIDTFSQRCAFWWLSVDNFGQGNVELVKNAVIHLTQSEYARQHVVDTFGVQPLMVTDYINTVFNEDENTAKHLRVAVNPAKGKHLIDEFKIKFPEIIVIELTGMPRGKVKTELGLSAIYIDFGHHPGRDRFPREACLSETVVMTTRLGSAGNGIDVPIDEWYKFNTVDEVGAKVKEVFADFNKHILAQKPYLEAVLSQRQEFKQEVEKLLQFSKTGMVL